MHLRLALWGLVLSLCALGASPARAQANLIVNGSFEQPLLAPTEPFRLFLRGSTDIPGWTVIAPGVSHGVHVAVVKSSFSQYGYSFPAHDGNQWLDLAGYDESDNDHEGVEQTVATTPGAIYTLSFWIGNVYDASTNPGSYGQTGTVELYVDDALVGTYTNSAVATTLQWQRFAYTLTATGATTKIGFVSADPNYDNNNALDDVRLTLPTAAVTAVPAPAVGARGLLLLAALAVLCAVHALARR